MDRDPDGPEDVKANPPDDAKPAKRPVGGQSKSTFAPLNMTVEEAVAELSTAEGILKRRAELYLRTRKGGTAMELEYIRREEALLNKLEASITARDQIKAAQELKAALESMQKLSQGTRNDAARRNAVTTPPIVARGKGSLQ